MNDLTTERLILKYISQEDREFMFKHFCADNVAVNKYLYDNEPYSKVEEVDGLIQFYNMPEPRGQYRWIIIDKATGAKIGTCGFHCWNDEENYIEIGYDLEEEYWGKGYMYEALSEILPFPHKQMGVNKICAHISTDNAKSISLVKRLGFEYKGNDTIYTFRGIDYLHNVYEYEEA